MRVFLAGASGAIGRPLTPKLVAARHEVTGTTRSEASAETIRAAGARAAVLDVLDAERLHAAVADARAEVVIHELTSLPDRLDFRKQDVYEPTNRVGTEGTRNLLDAARAADARRFVCQSIAFAYEPAGARVKTEEDALMDSAPGPFGGGIRALHEMERLVLDAEDLEGVVLRYNITDDEPVEMSEWLPAFARAVGAKRPFRVPVWLARFVGGREVPTFALELRGASNEKAKRELGWEPAHPTWRTSFAEALG